MMMRVGELCQVWMFTVGKWWPDGNDPKRGALEKSRTDRNNHHCV